MILFTLLFFFSTIRLPPRSTLFPYTTLFRSIAEFMAGVRDVDRIVLHCNMGMSRSPGVALGLCDLHGWATAEIAQSEGKDRKSTRLNSSHVEISYAVFCLKKKKKKELKKY